MLTFVGHDFNIIGFIKNFLDEELLESYLHDRILDPDVFYFMMPTFSSMFELHLVEQDGEIFVKLYLNGLQNFVKLRGGIAYDFHKGVPYAKFREILQSRMFPEYKQCLMTKDEKE